MERIVKSLADLRLMVQAADLKTEIKAELLAGIDEVEAFVDDYRKRQDMLENHQIRSPLARILGLSNLGIDGNMSQSDALVWIWKEATDLDNLLHKIFGRVIVTYQELKDENTTTHEKSEIEQTGSADATKKGTD